MHNLGSQLMKVESSWIKRNNVSDEDEESTEECCKKKAQFGDQ